MTKNPAIAALTELDLEREIDHRLGISVTLRSGFDRLVPAIATGWPAISVIVCTRDRPYALRRCLGALSRLDYESYEVVVIDNASRTSETLEFVKGTPFRCVREERQGLDWARNRGLREARHDIVAFVDDDAIVDAGWLRGMARGFAEPEVMAVTGLVLPAELMTRAQHIIEGYGNGMSKGFKPKRFAAADMSVTDRIEVHRIGVGTNMAYRRIVFDEIGAFDTALDVGTPSGGAGDLDMFHRVLLAGGVIRYEPEALVWHQHRRDMEGLRRQLYQNGCGFGVFLIKRLREAHIRRGAVARYAIGRWGRWLVGRLVIKRYRHGHDLPWHLMWAELRGALHAPWAYLATYRHDRRTREKFGIDR